MSDSNYLIEILLTARDEASEKIRNLQRQVNELRSSAAGRNATSDLERGFDDLGDSAGDSADEIERHNQETERMRRQAPQTRAAIDEHAKAHDRGAEAAGRHADAQADVVDEARRGKEAFNDQRAAMEDAGDEAEAFAERLRAVEKAEEVLHARFQGNNAELQKYADGLDMVSKAYGRLARESDLGSRQADDMLARQRAVRNESSRLGSTSSGNDLASSYKEFDDAARKGRLTDAEARRGYQNFAGDLARVSHAFDNGSDSAREFGRMSDNAKGRLVELSGGLKDVESKTRDLDTAQAALYQRFNSGQSTLQKLADGLGIIRQRYVSLVREAPLGGQIAEDLLARSRVVGTDSRQFRAQAVGSDLKSSYSDSLEAIKNGDMTTKEARRTLQSYVSDFTKVSRAFEDGSAAARDFGRMADDAGNKLKNIRMAQSTNDLEKWASKFSQVTDNIGIKVISLSAALRGFRVVGIVGLIQVLDTAIVGLAGSLVSIASDAAEAGAALGGSLVSGLSQAAPVVTVLLAGLQRLKNILDAVKISQELQQQQQFDPTQALSTQLQTTESLISAQQGLVDAYNNVNTAQIQLKESQEELTEARIAAIRNITDLTMAEKTAAEEATGAKLSLTQAEQQLQQIEATGGTQLQIQQAQLAVQEARTQKQTADIAVPRAKQDLALARRYGVSGNEGLMGAQLSRIQAELAVQRAPAALQEAKDELKIAQMTAASPSGRETSTQGQLNYLLGQMSSPEKLLYGSLDKLETQLRQPGSPIAKVGDALISPIAKGITQITQIFDNPKLMAPFEKLADAISKGLDQVFNVKRHISFFEDMTKDATKNAPIITKIIVDFESLFDSVARAAAPALHTLLLFIDGWATGLAKTEGSVSGQKRLTDEFDKWEARLETILHALHAFHGLLKAIGADAAPAGNQMFGGLTQTLNGATDWVKTHGPEVRKFFKDAMDVLSEIGGLLVTIGKLMISVFNLGSLQVFGQFAQQVLLPAITGVAKAIGTLMRWFMDFVNQVPYAKDLLIGLVAGFAGLLVLNKVSDAFLGATRGAQALWDAMKVFKETGSITSAFKTFADHMNGLGNAAHGAAQKVQQSATDTKNALSSEESGVASKTAVIDTEMAGPGLAAEKVPAKVALGAEGTEAALAEESTIVGADTAAIDTEMATIGIGAGLLVPAAAALAAGYGLVKIIQSGLSNGPGPPASVKTPAEYNKWFDKQNFAGRDPRAVDPSGLAAKGEDTQEAAWQKQFKLGSSENPMTPQDREALAAYQRLRDHAAGTAGIGIQARDNLTKPMKEAATTWANTFDGISQTTGNVMGQVKTTLAQNIQNISSNLGNGTKQGAIALVATISQAYETVLHNTSKTAQGASDGIGAIGKILDHALKVLGVKAPKGSTQLADLKVATGLTMPELQLTPGYAAGGWVDSHDGGGLYRAGEAGHDEVVLSTDPRHVDRQSALLGAYLQKAPAVRRKAYASGGLPFSGLGAIGSVGQDAVDDTYLAASQYLGANAPTAGFGVLPMPLGVRIANTKAVRGISSLISSNQQNFAKAMQKVTGLNIDVITGWLLNEQGKENANPASDGLYNFLNIGIQSATRKFGNTNPVWFGSPSQAGFYTGEFLEGQWAPSPGYYGDYPAIRGAVGANAAAQIAAIQSSGWASGGESSLGVLYDEVANSPHLAVGGMLTRQLRRHIQRHLRKKVLRFAEGGRAPWGGAPVPIIAHEGERVANPNQWAEVARLAGTTPSGLDSHLGYDRGSPKQHFATGGHVTPLTSEEFLASAQQKITTPAALTVASLSGIDLTTGLTVMAKIFSALKNGLQQFNTKASIAAQRAGVITGYTTWISNALSTYEQYVSSTFQTIQQNLTDAGERAGYKVSSSGTVTATTAGAAGFTMVSSGIGGPAGSPNIVVNQSGAGDATIVKSYEDQMVNMQEQQSFLKKTISSITGKIGQSKLIKNAAKRKAALTQLNSEYTRAQTDLSNLGDQMATNLQSTYQAEQQSVQDEITAISNVYQTQQAGLQSTQSSEQTLGQFNLLPAVDNALADSARNQVSALEDALQRATAMGDTTTAAQIQQQIDQLNSSITQYTAQAIQDAISAIQQAAQTDSSRTTMLSGLASVATSQGNFSLAGALSASSYTNAINSDTSQIIGYTGNAGADIQGLTAAQTAPGGSTLTSATMGNYGITASSILGQAIQSGNQGAVATIIQSLDGLDTDLATNTQALTDNTAATDNAAASYLQARGQFSSGIYGGLGQIIQAAGTATGNLDIPAMLQTYQGQNQSLQQTNAGLSSTLNSDFGLNVQGMSPTEFANFISGVNLPQMESGMDPAQVAEFENLIGSLTSNNEAIENNTIAINTLNGQLTQPQSFTSTAFSDFRDAIFTGMGGLVPAIASSLGVANPSNPGLAGTGAPGQIASTGPAILAGGPNTPSFDSGGTVVQGDQHIHVESNPILPAVDGGTQGRQIAFQLKQPSR